MEIRIEIVNRVLMIVSGHSNNYWLLSQARPLTYFIEVLPKLSMEVQSLIVKVRSSLCTHTHHLIVQSS